MLWISSVVVFTVCLCFVSFLGIKSSAVISPLLDELLVVVVSY